MVFTVRKKTESKQTAFNVQEVYSIWDLQTYKHWALEQLRLWVNFIHDPDLRMLCDSIAGVEKSSLKAIEKLISVHKLMGLASSRKKVYVPQLTDNIYDQHIASWLLSYMQGMLELKFRISRTAVSNDDLRNIVIKYMKEDVKTLDKTIKLVKLKGWINQPPTYPDVPKQCDENIDAGEAYHLWDHLTFRYDNIEFTQQAVNMAHDGDFKLMLKKGLQDILKKQAELLENEIIKFGLPMPQSPPEVITETQSTEYRTDSSIYKQLLQGMEGAVLLHTQAIKQSTTNDRVRSIFIKLFLEEMETVDKMVKFGKLKGWSNPPPSYRQ